VAGVVCARALEPCGREENRCASEGGYLLTGTSPPPEPGPFFHGTKAHLEIGSLLEPGYSSNFGARKQANFVYLTATLDAATWGAELALGEGRGRIYRVEPTGPIEDDPNLTDKKFPGNPTKSYRTRQPLRVIGEVVDWQGHPPEVLQQMRDRVAKAREQGIEAIND
jgi:rifampin ADP-ribosylating transferase